jgi:hypothetical protein
MGTALHLVNVNVVKTVPRFIYVVLSHGFSISHEWCQVLIWPMLGRLSGLKAESCSQIELATDCTAPFDCGSERRPSDTGADWQSKIPKSETGAHFGVPTQK